MGWLYAIESLIIPPGINLLLFILAMMIVKRWRRTAALLTLISVISLYLFSTGIVADSLIRSLQQYPALSLTDLEAEPEAAAVVILGAGRYAAAPEYEQRDAISPLTLERLRYGAKLVNQLKVPILLSGGRRNGESTAEAVLMNQVAVAEYGLSPSMLEVKSANSYQAANFIAEQLQEKGINTLFVVTHAWHMPRVVYLLRQRGFAVVPAPMGFNATVDSHLSWLPRASSLMVSTRAFHEMLALKVAQIQLMFK
jgi:uncharacterized SAM-binding protein YcdF (DUF218 family)